MPLVVVLIFLSQFTFRWYKVGRLSIRYRYRERPQNMTGEEPENTVVETQRRQLRIDFRYRLSAQWEVRTRTDGVVYTKANEDAYGGLLYQDVFLSTFKQPFTAEPATGPFSYG